MSTEASETKSGQAAKQAPTEQQQSQAGVPRRFAVGQTVCNEKNEKGKLCNGHLKERNTAHPSEVHLRGDDALHQCQTCGTLYMGPPLGHVRDSRKQSRYVERDLAAILRAAGGTLPAYTYPVPEWRRASLPQTTPAANKTPAPPEAETTPATTTAPPPAAPKAAPAARAETRPASPSSTTAAPPAAAAPEGETPQQKRARIIAELNAKYAGKTAPPRKKKTDEESAAATPSPSPTQAATGEAATAAVDSSAPGVGSSAEADRHRPAAEAQAATGQASAAPLSPAASTASPAAGAETVADLAAEASTELTPGAPKADAPAAAVPAEAAPEKRKAAGQRNRGPRELPPHLRPPEGETHEEKIARLAAFVEEAKRKAGKL